MEIKISTFIFILLCTVPCSLTKSNDFETGEDFEMQNDDNYEGNYDDTDDTVEEKKMPELPLQINTREEKFIKNIGDTVQLPCEITGSNYVQVWRKKNSQSKDSVLFQSGIQMAATANMKLMDNGSLEISNLHVQDAGEYECSAMDTKQNSPKIQHTVLLNVPPKIELLKAMNDKKVLQTGDILKLNCRANGFPKPVISWHKGDSRFDMHGEVLEIPNVKHHHAGTYKCLADNKIGEPAFSFINIKVEFRPTVIIEKKIVRSENNSQTELECQVHSEPRAQVVWKKDGLNIVNSEHVQLVTKGHHHNLILKDLEDSDFGDYICSATNSLGTSAKNISLMANPAIYRLSNVQTDGKLVLIWEVQSKTNLSSNKLSYRRKSDWTIIHPEDKLEVKFVDDDIYEVHYTFNKGLDPGEYEFKLESQNEKGWSEYSKKISVDVYAKHGHHKSHKKNHKHGKDTQVTPTLPTQPDIPAEHQENESHSGLTEESWSPGPETSDSPSIAPRTLLISIVLFTVFQLRLMSLRI